MTSSPVSMTFSMCDGPARFWPATSQPLRNATASSRYVASRFETLTGPPPSRATSASAASGSGGLPSVSDRTSPFDGTHQTKTGAPSVPWSSATDRLANGFAWWLTSDRCRLSRWSTSHRTRRPRNASSAAATPR